MTRKRLLQLLEAAKSETSRDKMFSVRLTSAEYERLAQVAGTQGLGAATLARVLIVAGLEDLEADGGR